MDIRNCKICGSMFQYVGDKVCPKCKQELEAKLEEVKAYIHEHERVTVSEVSEELNVPVKQIRRWIQEDRLMFAPGVDTGLVCSKCGMPIESGSMCQKCRDNLKHDFEKVGRAVSQPEKHVAKDGARMHLSRYE